MNSSNHVSCAVFIYIIFFSRNAFSKSSMWTKKYSTTAGMIPEGKDLGDFHTRQWRSLRFLCSMHIAWWCHLRNSPEGQNIQRNTGGIDPISINATMGAFKLYKYSLSEFQWRFWISQLPSRISKNKRIKPNNFECRTALEGEEGSVGNSYIGTVQMGSISKAFF